MAFHPTRRAAACFAGITLATACSTGEKVSTECYSVTQDQTCKAAAAITVDDLPYQGSMTFQGVNSGPTRNIERTDCCSYLVSEEKRYGCTLLPPDSGTTLCPEVGETDTVPWCLPIEPDASCPDAALAAADLQSGRSDVRIISVLSPGTLRVSIIESCCYEVRRKWDGG
jgi:hypothetical protein